MAESENGVNELTLKQVCDYLGLTSVYPERVLALLPKIKVKNIECDSRRVTQGSIFYARRGAHYNPFEHLDEIRAKGAVAILVDGPSGVTSSGLPVWLDDFHQDIPSDQSDAVKQTLSDTRDNLRRDLRCGNLARAVKVKTDEERSVEQYHLMDDTFEAEAIAQAKMMRLVLPDYMSLSQLAGFIYGDPSAHRIRVIGITGTNGKSTVTSLIAQMLNACGHKAVIFGTLGYGFLHEMQHSSNTTLDAISLQRELAHYASLGADYAVMEVSSIGFCEGRVSGITFYGGGFTNLSRDHLDYHLSMDDYFMSKLNFLKKVPPARLAVNCSNPSGQRVMDHIPGCYTVYTGIDDSSRPLTQSLSVRQIRYRPSGIDLFVCTRANRTTRVELNLLGHFNAENYALALGVMLSLGYDPKFLFRIAPQLRPVTGRMECFTAEGLPRMIVDYAHTPDGVEQALKAAHNHTGNNGRIFAIVGCGGDRDRGKRPLMAMKASVYADYAIFTADNPRSEDLSRIIDDMQMGILPSPEEIKLRQTLKHADDILENVAAKNKASGKQDNEEPAIAFVPGDGTSLVVRTASLSPAQGPVRAKASAPAAPARGRGAAAKAAAAAGAALTVEAYDQERYRRDRTIVNHAPHGKYYETHAVCSGLPEGLPPADAVDRNVIVIADRYQAIRYAFEHAKKQDCILVAGKGHEDYQIFADGTIHFSDREICCELLGIELKSTAADSAASTGSAVVAVGAGAAAAADKTAGNEADKDAPAARAKVTTGKKSGTCSKKPQTEAKTGRQAAKRKSDAK